MAEFDAVVLSAGFSSRMDGFKPLYRLGDDSALAGVIGCFKEAGAREVLVVCGHNAEMVRAEAEKHKARPVFNPDFAEGMFTSVQAGAKALEPGADAFFVLPVDIPLVRSATVRRIWDDFLENKAGIIHPVFAGERGHPPLLAASLAGDIVSWSGEMGLRGLLEHAEAGEAVVREIQVADHGTILDMDTEDDYRRLSRMRRDIPDAAECAALLELAGTPEPTVLHGRAVARVAMAMARAINRNRDQDHKLDLELIERAGQLHDIAKGHKRHETRGAQFVSDMGFPVLYKAIACHRDIPPEPGRDLDEACLVFMADKVVKGERLVTVHERYGMVLQYHGHIPEAREAIERRLSNGLAMFELVERAVGEDLMGLAVKALEGE